MDPYEIYIAYISWNSDGKHRPILFLEKDNGYAEAFRVTSQYANKSDDIKAQYIEITDWQQAGLLKLSYIDAGEKVRIPLTLISPQSPIGKLSESDKQRLLEFLLK
jgi:hypothetical protein